MKYDVFISYSRKDYLNDKGEIIQGNIVSQIRDLLDTNGFSYWFDEKGIYHGDKFATVIAKNIKQSRIFLFIATENSNSSRWTAMEIAVAYEYGAVIIPFRYDHSQYAESVVLYMAPLDRIDYLDEQRPMETLVESIKHHLAEIKGKEYETQRVEKEKKERELQERQRAEKLLEAQIDEHKRKITELKKELEQQQTELKYLEIQKGVYIEVPQDSELPHESKSGFYKRIQETLKDIKKHPILFGCSGSIILCFLISILLMIIGMAGNDDLPLTNEETTTEQSIENSEENNYNYKKEVSIYDHRDILWSKTIKTTSHIVRIECLYEDNYRYLSWNIKNGKNGETRPSLKLIEGYMEDGEFIFKNGGKTFYVPNNKGESLIVKQADKVIVEEIITDFNYEGVVEQATMSGK